MTIGQLGILLSLGIVIWAAGYIQNRASMRSFFKMGEQDRERVQGFVLKAPYLVWLLFGASLPRPYLHKSGLVLQLGAIVYLVTLLIGLLISAPAVWIFFIGSMSMFGSWVLLGILDGRRRKH